MQVLHLEVPADSDSDALPVLPADTSESLVFASSELAKLRLRISELAQEKSEARHVLKALRAENGVLRREQGGKAEKLRDLEERAYDVQMLKFGQVTSPPPPRPSGISRAPHQPSVLDFSPARP